MELNETKTIDEVLAWVKSSQANNADEPIRQALHRVADITWIEALQHAEIELAMRGGLEWVQEAIEIVRYDRNTIPEPEGGR